MGLGESWTRTWSGVLRLQGRYRVTPADLVKTRLDADRLQGSYPVTAFEGLYLWDRRPQDPAGMFNRALTACLTREGQPLGRGNPGSLTPLDRMAVVDGGYPVGYPVAVTLERAGGLIIWKEGGPWTWYSEFWAAVAPPTARVQAGSFLCVLCSSTYSRVHMATG